MTTPTPTPLRLVHSVTEPEPAADEPLSTWCQFPGCDEPATYAIYCTGQARRCYCDAHERAARRQIKSFQYSEPIGAEAWSDTDVAIAKLARTFPSLEGAPLLPWAPIEFLRWAIQQRDWDDSSDETRWQAALFVLSVASPAEWSQVAIDEGFVEVSQPRLRARIAKEFSFQMALAWTVWDAEHRAALRAWLSHPVVL